MGCLTDMEQHIFALGINTRAVSSWGTCTGEVACVEDSARLIAGLVMKSLERVEMTLFKTCMSYFFPSGGAATSGRMGLSMRVT